MVKHLNFERSRNDQCTSTRVAKSVLGLFDFWCTSPMHIVERQEVKAKNFPRREKRIHSASPKLSENGIGLCSSRHRRHKIFKQNVTFKLLEMLP